MEELNLKDIFNIFWKRKIAVIVILIVSITAGVLYSLLTATSVYSSYTTLLLIPEETEIISSEKEDRATTFSLNSRLVNTYYQLIKSKENLGQILDELKIEDIEEETLGNSIQVYTLTDTGVIQILVTLENPEYAEKIANKLAESFDEKFADMYINNNVTVIDRAEVAKQPNSINHKKNIIVFGFVGCLIACGYVFLMNMLHPYKKENEK